MKILSLSLIIILVSCAPQKGEESTTTEVQSTEETEKPYVYFANIEDGDVVSSPLTIEMGVQGMEVEPAGEQKEGYGHHHLVIDGGFIPAGRVVPADSLNIHYGLGQTVTEPLILSPGKHTLTLQFADGFHLSYGESLSTSIEVTIKEE